MFFGWIFINVSIYLYFLFLDNDNFTNISLFFLLYYISIMKLKNFIKTNKKITFSLFWI